MTKHQGKYYLQYAAPGTQFHSYADGVFVGTAPLGPFHYDPTSPFSHKPTGFITGAGHSGSFTDARGEYWHVSTMVISVRHMFERRLGIFPMDFSADNHLTGRTYLGDYPQFVPGTHDHPARENSPGWLLLSYGHSTTASSSQTNHSPALAADENIQTWWAAASGAPGEWWQVNLGKSCRLEALQINFADEGAHYHGKLSLDTYQYYVEGSTDGQHWRRILDRSANQRDTVHDYEPLPRSEMARYIRITNVHCPAGAVFSLSDLRVFGNGLSHPPAPVKELSVAMDPEDPRHALVRWQPVSDSSFQIVRYGIARDQLFQNYQVYQTNTVSINSLNAGVKYYFTVDSVNDSGITPGTEIVSPGIKP